VTGDAGAGVKEAFDEELMEEEGTVEGDVDGPVVAEGATLSRISRVNVSPSLKRDDKGVPSTPSMTLGGYPPFTTANQALSSPLKCF